MEICGKHFHPARNLRMNWSDKLGNLKMMKDLFEWEVNWFSHEKLFFTLILFFRKFRNLLLWTLSAGPVAVSFSSSSSVRASQWTLDEPEDVVSLLIDFRFDDLLSCPKNIKIFLYCFLSLPLDDTHPHTRLIEWFVELNCRIEILKNRNKLSTITTSHCLTDMKLKCHNWACLWATKSLHTQELGLKILEKLLPMVNSIPLLGVLYSFTSSKETLFLSRWAATHSDNSFCNSNIINRLCQLYKQAKQRGNAIVERK